MNVPRRKIRIKMSPRVASDSQEILGNVNDVFEDADIEIDISEIPSADLDQLDEPLAVESAQNALDLQDRAIREGMATVSSPEEAKTNTHQWLATVREQGIKVTTKLVLEKLWDVAGAAAEKAPGVIKEVAEKASDLLS